MAEREGTEHSILHFEGSVIKKGHEVMPILRTRSSFRHWCLFAFCAAYAMPATSTPPIEGPLGEPHADRSASTAKGKTEVVFLSDANQAKYTAYDDSHGIILFRASINGKSTWGVLDTAADRLLVDNSLFVSTGGRLVETDVEGRSFGQQFDLAVANGVTFEFTSQFMFTGNFFAAELTALSERLDKPIGVILGSNVLKRIAFLCPSSDKLRHAEVLA